MNMSSVSPAPASSSMVPTNAIPASATNATAIASNKTQPMPYAKPASSTPGFEGIFTITGLMAITYFVLGRKQ
jgi:hypothetical protein